MLFMRCLELSFKVENVSCANCQLKIMQFLERHQSNLTRPSSLDLKKSYFNLDNKILTLFIYTEQNPIQAYQQLLSFLQQRVFPQSKFKVDSAWAQRQLQALKQNIQLDRQAADRSHYWGALVGLSMGVLWIVLMLSGAMLQPLFIWGSSLLLMSVAKPFFLNAWFQLKSAWRSPAQAWFNMDSLFVLTGMIVIGVSIASLYSPIFSCMMEAGFFIFGFRHLGCIFQAYLDRKMGFSTPWVQRFRDRPFALSNSRFEKLDLQAAHLFNQGDWMVCKAGDILPVDGVIKAFSSDVELVDHMKSGTYLALESVKIGQLLLAGMSLTSGEVLLQVTEPLSSSRLAQLDESVANMRSVYAPAPIISQTSRWLQWFIPGLLVLSAVTGIWIGQLFSLKLAIECVVSILVSACPCTLGLIIPMALQIGAYKASLQDAVFKSGEALQMAARASICILDYNGTMTRGKPWVSHLEVMDGVSEQHVTQLIYSMECKMLAKRSQVIGQAIQTRMKQWLDEAEVKQQNQFEAMQFEDLRFGGSLTGDTETYWFGNHNLLRHLDVIFPDVQEIAYRHYLIAQQSIDAPKQLLAYVDIADEVREDAPQFVQSLQAQGKHVVVCTGADELTADKIARVLHLSRSSIRASCLPESKLAVIDELRQQYPEQIICMLGDGANDKLALEASDLRVWLKNKNLPDDLQVHESANLEIHSDELQALLKALHISEQTFDLIYQNLYFSFAYNLAVLTLACGGLLIFGMVLHPAIGVSLMIAQSALLALNAYRILQKPLELELGEQTLPVDTDSDVLAVGNSM
jgi:Cu2+-exporting ATPase